MSVYDENGYASREDYLRSLAELYNIPYNLVTIYANLYGPAEDFDALLTELESLSMCEEYLRDEESTVLRGEESTVLG